NLPRPTLETGKPIIVSCPMSAKQQALQQKLVERYERLRSQKVDPREDNALNITTDGRKLATDARMLTSSAPDFPESKVNRLVDNVAAIWERSTATRGTQMIFSDMGVNPTPWDYSPYEEIIEKLVGRGIPREQIAAIGEAESDAKKQALFERVRNGSVRVLIGSTQKMGTGTNVQKRLVALHHLDAPWKPAEVEQRDGRILRQGNENPEVAIYRYVTEASFDAYMWQALETKARFISQVMTGDNALRKSEDIGGQELSYAEVKAIASGNPAVLTLAEAEADLQRLTLLKRNHLDEQFVARRSVRDLPGTISNLSDRLSRLSDDRATLETHAEAAVAIGGRTYPREDVVAVLGSKLDALPQTVREQTPISLGQFRGLRFGIVLHPRFATEVYLEGAATRQTALSREHQGPRAVLNALERLARDYPADCDRLRQELAIAEAQLRDFQSRLGQPFAWDSYLTELTMLRHQLKAGLSAAAPNPGQPDQPTASDIVARIKALKGGQTLEAGPHRARQKIISAEEPVTARIRRRSLAPTADGSMPEEDVANGATGPLTASSQRADADVPPSFRDRLTRERLSQLEEPTRT
ncbi:MAG TPA: helicase-related protein, partial [Planctomycetaceae bacterium]|nr:helicase-related protein [Planctomycetaceae bacterium]